MKNVFVILLVIGCLLGIAMWVFPQNVQAATPDSTAEIVKAINIQNQQLARIATSLEIISGQKQGWKLPK